MVTMCSQRQLIVVLRNQLPDVVALRRERQRRKRPTDRDAGRERFDVLVDGVASSQPVTATTP
jgi:hypothetical protein